MIKKVANKTLEDATVENISEKTNLALAGIKKSAIAVRQAANKIASAPSRMLNSAVYGSCYGISYGAVFTFSVIANSLPANSPVAKGFHDGAVNARHDFKTRKEKPVLPDDATVAG